MTLLIAYKMQQSISVAQMMNNISSELLAAAAFPHDDDHCQNKSVVREGNEHYHNDCQQSFKTCQGSNQHLPVLHFCILPI